MRRFPATFNTRSPQRPRAVLALDALASEWVPDRRYAVLVSSAEERRAVERLAGAGLDVVWVQASEVRTGDVVALNPHNQSCTVLYRPADQHHALLLTNRCNSHCLMCSQPPTAGDDSWLVEQALDVIRHIPLPPRALGLTGGETTLLRSELARVTGEVARCLPGTQIEILTNARMLADTALASELLRTTPAAATTWLVPLYGHADFLHDFVVQAPGALDETIAGLLNLQEFGHAVQLRTVLIQPVLEHLPALAQFIARNLPFVREVALMAAEPIGFALANRDLCAVNLSDWHDTLRSATRILQRYAVPFMFMNVPLCTLPAELRQHAQRSISDWKNAFAPECKSCAAREDCCGLFTWYEKGWRPSKLIPITASEEAV